MSYLYDHLFGCADLERFWLLERAPSTVAIYERCCSRPAATVRPKAAVFFPINSDGSCDPTFRRERDKSQGPAAWIMDVTRELQELRRCKKCG